jgi:uncharacterized protein (DUF488 family)
MQPIFSIGHSNHGFDAFTALLRPTGITTIADVRSQPWSRFAVDFRQPVLKEKLSAAGISYIYVGDALGGRPKGEHLNRDGHVDYDAVAREPFFTAGLDRLLDLAQYQCIAMMCAERHPADCHRSRLIGRSLLQRGLDVRHILVDGTQVMQSELEPQPGLFA